MSTMTVSSGQTLIVSAGQTSSGVDVLSGGTLEVLAGGVVVDDALLSGATLSLVSGSLARSTSDSPGSVISASGGTLAYSEAAGVTSSIQADLVGFGVVVQSGPGTLLTSAAQDGGEYVAVISGGRLEVDGNQQNATGVFSFGGVTFAPGASGTLQIDNEPFVGNYISGLAPGDVIDLPQLPFDGTTSVTNAGDYVFVTESSQGQYLNISGGQYQQFVAGPDGLGGTTVTETTPEPVISSGQTLVVSSGQTLPLATVLSGGTLEVLSGGTVVSGTIYGAELVSGGADSSVISSGGVVTVSSGGRAHEFVAPGGVLIISSSGFGEASFDPGIGLGGTQIVLAGGTASGSEIASVLVSGGSITSATDLGSFVVEGATDISGTVVIATGSAVGTVAKGVDITVGMGGVTTGTQIYGDLSNPFGTYSVPAFETISSGGVASATLLYGSTDEILSGGLAVNPTVTSDATVADSGTLLFSEAAGATSTFNGTLTGSGALVQSGPGTLALSGTLGGFTGTAIISGGTLELTSANAAGDGTIAFAAGASAMLLVGGAMPPNTISGFATGDAIDLAGLAFGGTTSATVSGSAVTVTEGLQSAVLTIAGAASEQFRAAADSQGGTVLTVAPPTISSFADYVGPGESISDVVLAKSDDAFVFAGGAASSVDVAGGVLAVFGSASFTTVESGGNVFVKAGNDDAATVGSGGILWVSGGVDSGASVYGLENVYGGVASAGTVHSGGLVVVAGGTASGTVVDGGALAISGGAASNAVVENGGNEFLLAGANVAAAVSAGGTLFVSAGIDTATVLGSQGIEFVTGRGVADGATVGAGAALVLQSGGAQFGTVLLSGGAIDLKDFAFANVSQFAFDSATTTVTFAAGGAVHSVGLAGSYAGLGLGASADSGGGLLITAK